MYEIMCFPLRGDVLFALLWWFLVFVAMAAVVS